MPVLETRFYRISTFKQACSKYEVICQRSQNALQQTDDITRRRWPESHTNLTNPSRRPSLSWLIWMWNWTSTCVAAQRPPLQAPALGSALSSRTEAGTLASDSSQLCTGSFHTSYFQTRFVTGNENLSLSLHMGQVKLCTLEPHLCSSLNWDRRGTSSK